MSVGINFLVTLPALDRQLIVKDLFSVEKLEYFQ